MPGTLYHVGGTCICPHGGMVNLISTNTRVLASGMQVATLPDTLTIAGCAFTIPGPKPQPCVPGRFLVGTTRVFVNGTPVVPQSGTGLCQSADQIPQGPPTVVATQPRVVGM